MKIRLDNHLSGDGEPVRQACPRALTWTLFFRDWIIGLSMTSSQDDSSLISSCPLLFFQPYYVDEGKTTIVGNMSWVSFACSSRVKTHAEEESQADGVMFSSVRRRRR